MKKRFLALICVAALAVSMLAGCSKNTGTGGDKVTDTPTSAPTEKPADNTATPIPTPMPTPEPAGMTFTGAPNLAGNVEDRLPVADDVFVETTDAAGNALEIGSWGGR